MSSVQSGGPSSIDMSQFYQVFFEEAQEHLGEMESLLLSIDPAVATPDELNAIFRAAHSIKGGSGTFGFTDMTEVTHELESLLDRSRSIWWMRCSWREMYSRRNSRAIAARVMKCRMPKVYASASAHS